MPNDPFTTDYAGAPQTQAAISPSAPVRPNKVAGYVDQPMDVDIETVFKITPIPMADGKPRRVIIKGKITRD